MPELTSRERLQPSLLDRLRDDERDKRDESREQRVISPRKLKEYVIRDLAWLLNACDLDSVVDLTPYPEVERSVLNFGLPDLAGRNVSGLDVIDLERALRKAILAFEPRILRRSLVIRAAVDDQDMGRNAVRFDIEGALWGVPTPQQLYLRTKVDLETGDIEVSETTTGR
jgi:type VI secretion system protein ImpF